MFRILEPHSVLEVVYSKLLTLQRRKQVQRGGSLGKGETATTLLAADNPADAKLLRWSEAP